MRTRPVATTRGSMHASRVLSSRFRMQMDATGRLRHLARAREHPRDVWRQRPWRQTLIARRLLERGVRFVQLWHGAGQPWDHHDNIEANIRKHSADIDGPIAAFITDLKARGMFETRLSFGVENLAARRAWSWAMAQIQAWPDHNHYGFSVWLAGGGIRGGRAYGATDEFGFKAVENRSSVHDLHATMLHCLGFDHERLTYRHAGRDFPPYRRERQRDSRNRELAGARETCRSSRLCTASVRIAPGGVSHKKAPRRLPSGTPLSTTLKFAQFTGRLAADATCAGRCACTGRSCGRPRFAGCVPGVVPGFVVPGRAPDSLSPALRPGWQCPVLRLVQVDRWCPEWFLDLSADLFLPASRAVQAAFARLQVGCSRLNLWRRLGGRGAGRWSAGIAFVAPARRATACPAAIHSPSREAQRSRPACLSICPSGIESGLPSKPKTPPASRGSCAAWKRASRCHS
jgi:hypothetical protein